MVETPAKQPSQDSQSSSAKPSVVTEPAVTSTVDDRSAEPADQAPASRTAKKPVAKKPVAKKPVAKKPVAKKPVAKKPVAKKPVAKKPVAKKPVAKKPAAKKPAAKKARAKRAPVKRAPARRAPAKRSVARSRASRSRAAGARRPTSFKVGDKVVHPHHGAAVITKRVDQEIVGETRSYFVLQIATEQLTVFVPVDTIDQTIRPVISKTAAGKVLRIFKEDPQASGKNWSRWYKVLNEKMTSGDIHQVAEVVRDLTHAQIVKGISPALKRMLSRARVTLISELEFAFGVDTEDATRRLDRVLPKPEDSEA